MIEFLAANRFGRAATESTVLPAQKSQPLRSVPDPCGLEQQGAARGYNPRRPGRRSHHPLFAVLAEANFVLHAWLRSGNTGAGQGATQFLSEALSLLGSPYGVHCVRADSGFYADNFLSFLEERALRQSLGSAGGVTDRDQGFSALIFT